MRQRLRAARTIQRFLSRRIWRREIAKLKYHRACIKVQTLWRKKRAQGLYRRFVTFICKCQSRARIRGAKRLVAAKQSNLKVRVVRWCVYVSVVCTFNGTPPQTTEGEAQTSQRVEREQAVGARTDATEG